jgi:UDP-N-acetylmuramoyl-tripeptide--D-alanyl-D-alanine ligase
MNPVLDPQAGVAMMTCSQAAHVLNGKLAGADAEFARVTTDSRAVQEGDLFVALKGPNFDGHDFVPKAAESGAAAALVSRALPDSLVPQIVVDDTRLALGHLAAHWRGRFAIPLIALTGSNGKTTVKEMLRSILTEAASGQGFDASAVYATEGNLNNDIGMPLTLLRLRTHHRYAIIEMGMNHLGEIDYLTHIAKPDVALVINAGTAHIGELGSREAIAEAKGEIYRGLGPEGVAVVNMHDRFGEYWRDLVKDKKTVTFGIAPEDDVSAVFGDDEVTLTYQGETVSAWLNVPGEHNQRNALAASAAAIALGIDLQTVQRGLENFGGVAGRLQKLEGINGAVVIHDAYNANPDSVRAAIDVLSRKEGTRILVLGDMGELGADSRAMHEAIGDYVKHAGLAGLFALGKMTEHTVMHLAADAWHFDTVDELCEELVKHMDSTTTVLVKGSRFMKMERVVERIAVGFDAGGH